MPGFKPGTSATRANVLPLAYPDYIPPETVQSLVGTAKYAEPWIYL